MIRLKNIFTILSDEEIKEIKEQIVLVGYHYTEAFIWDFVRKVDEAQKLHTLQQVIKLYEDMALVPEEDSPYYSFWLELKAMVAKVNE